MRSRINWLGICKDWASSGLSKNRYFLSNRMDRFVSSGPTPCRASVLRHLKEFERSNSASTENSASCSCPNAQVIVHHLSASDVRTATSAIPCHTAVSKRVTLMLANGSSIEFETGSPERFALQALTIGGLS